MTELRRSTSPAIPTTTSSTDPGMNHLLPVVIGFLLDLCLGDPSRMPHPVIGMGRLISQLEQWLRRDGQTPGEAYRAGLLLWFIVVLVCGGLCALVIFLATALHPVLGLAVESILCWQVLATRSLVTEARKVEQPLLRGDLPEARRAVSMIVGRDTESLSADGVAKAAIETVAENTSDGIVAPLLFLFLGGAPLGIAYKAVNTMDSMIGYIDEPYTHFGRFAARADDFFNYLPARLCALMMLLAGLLLGLDGRQGWRVFRRDRYKHASPNSAQTESVMAGLLRVQLAGDASYGGHLHHKPFIGDPLRPVEPQDISRSCRVAVGTAILSLLIFGSITYLIIH